MRVYVRVGAHARRCLWRPEDSVLSPEASCERPDVSWETGIGLFLCRSSWEVLTTGPSL